MFKAVLLSCLLACNVLQESKQQGPISTQSRQKPARIRGFGQKSAEPRAGSGAAQAEGLYWVLKVDEHLKAYLKGASSKSFQPKPGPFLALETRAPYLYEESTWCSHVLAGSVLPGQLDAMTVWNMLPVALHCLRGVRYCLATRVPTACYPS